MYINTNIYIKTVNRSAFSSQLNNFLNSTWQTDAFSEIEVDIIQML